MSATDITANCLCMQLNIVNSLSNTPKYVKGNNQTLWLICGKHGITSTLLTLPSRKCRLIRGALRLIGRFDAFRLKGHGFDSRSCRHVGTLGKSFTHSYLCASAWNSGTVSLLCWERLRVVVELKRHYKNSLNEWQMNEWHKTKPLPLVCTTVQFSSWPHQSESQITKHIFKRYIILRQNSK